MVALEVVAMDVVLEMVFANANLAMVDLLAVSQFVAEAATETMAFAKLLNLVAA